MSGPVYLTQPNIVRLPLLLSEIRNGQIRIPRFQRPFIWTDEQRLLLLESIYQGMPIGSILVWRTREHDLRSYDHIGHLPLGSRKAGEGSREEVTQYVLDGHQRLTTLYTALGRGLIDEEDLEKQEVDASARESEQQADRDWTIYFDLEEKTFTFHRKRAEEPPLTWLPLAILFDPYKLHAFQGKLTERGVEQQLIHRTASLASTFNDYSVPVVPIVTEDLELATESFWRINSAGTHMDQVQMVSALTWSPEFDLNERMGEVRDELAQVGWQDLEERIILDTCKAFLGLDVFLSDVKAIQREFRSSPGILDDVTLYLLEAAKFLRDRCKVYGPATLPYSFQIILLTDAIRRGTNDPTEEIGEDLADRLRRWFWITTYTEYFASINSTRLRLELEHLAQVATDGKDPMPPSLSSPPRVRAIRRFDFRAARSRALALRLAERSERPAEAFELLAEKGREAAPMLISSRKLKDRSLAEEPANRIVIDPRELSHFRKNVGELPVETLERHLITDEMRGALVQENWQHFVALRRDALDRIEREFVEGLGLEYVLE